MGCSSGFNFNLYKEYIHIKPNSSGREQIHSEMEKCGKHLIQLNYRNYQQKKINDLILIVLLIKYHVGGVSGWRLGWEGGKVGRWEGWKVGGWEVGSRKPAGEPPEWVNDTWTMWLI